MEFLSYSTLTVPVALAPPSTAAAEDEVVQSFLGQEAPWWPVQQTSFDDREEFSVDSSAEGEKTHVNLLFIFITGNIMPFFLMLQWVLAVYAASNNGTTIDIGSATLLAIVAMFVVLMIFYRKTMQHSFWALLAPSILLAVANALVLFQCVTFAFWVIGSGLVGMAGVVSFENWFRSRDNDHDREWLLQDEHKISFGLQELQDP